jgi:hypothetical protein
MICLVGYDRLVLACFPARPYNGHRTHHAVPYKTDLLVARSQAINYLATIVPSLRDKALCASSQRRHFSPAALGALRRGPTQTRNLCNLRILTFRRAIGLCLCFSMQNGLS